MKDICFDFSNRRFVVTGASSGLGRQIVIDLAEAGAKILAIARNEERLHQIHTLYPEQIQVASCDVCNVKAMEEIINAYVSVQGKLHGCVHAAGINRFTPFRIADENISHQIMQVSFWAGINLLRICCKPQCSAHCMSAVLFSSVFSYTGSKGQFAYSAAKAAVAAAVRSIAKEISNKGQRVNAIAPGWIKTEMTDKFTLSSDAESRYLLGIGDPNVVSYPVLFLLSDAAQWITGTNMVVDGGYLA